MNAEPIEGEVTCVSCGAKVYVRGQLRAVLDKLLASGWCIQRWIGPMEFDPVCPKHNPSLRTIR